MDIITLRKITINNVNLGEYVHAEIIINGMPFAEIAEKHKRIRVLS